MCECGLWQRDPGGNTGGDDAGQVTEVTKVMAERGGPERRDRMSSAVFPRSSVGLD